MTTNAFFLSRGVDVVADVDGSITSATPTPQDSLLFFPHVGVWRALSFDFDGSSTDERSPNACSSGPRPPTITPVLGPSSCSFILLLPAFIPSSAIWDEALARAVKQAASIGG